MALVLVGANSYSVAYTDRLGNVQRANVKKGQSIDALPLSADQIKELKSEVLMDGTRPVQVFVETSSTQEHPGRHTQGGTIGNHQIKAQREAKVVEAEAVAAPVVEPVVEVIAEVVVEPVAEEVAPEPVVEAPKSVSKAPVKKAKKSKK